MLPPTGYFFSYLREATDPVLGYWQLKEKRVKGVKARNKCRTHSMPWQLNVERNEKSGIKDGVSLDPG